MNDTQLIKHLTLKFMGYRARVKDLETEVAILKNSLKDKENLTREEKKSEQNKNSS